MAFRVLQVLDKISVDSGVSVMVMNYYKHLDHERLTFDFMINEEVDEATRIFIEGFGSKIYIMPKLRLKNIFKYVFELLKFYRQNEYKIIHGHVPNSAIFYFGLARRVPCKIMHSHSTKMADIFWKRIRNWLLTRFVKLVASEYAACSEDAARFLFGRNSKVTIINNAIDVERYLFNNDDRKNTRQSLGLTNEFLIGHIGRFSAVKNHQFILSVFSEVYEKNQDMRLILVGEGELKKEIVQKVERLGLSNVVTILSATNCIEKYMSAIDFLILPSLFEGLGLVGIEAQASGLNVLVSDKVPSAIDVTGNVDFLTLDRQLWVKKLLDIKLNIDRLEQGAKVYGSIYDLNVQMQKLYSYYEYFLK